MNFPTMTTWIEAATTGAAAGQLPLDQSPFLQEEEPMNLSQPSTIDSSSSSSDERNQSSSEDSGSGSSSEGGADESSSSSSAHVVLARMSDEMQKQKVDSDNSSAVNTNTSADQQNYSSPVSCSVVTVATKPVPVVVNYKDYSHELPTESELYLQQPGVANEELIMTTTTTTTPMLAAACLFPLKLHEMLSDIEHNGGLVGWQPHGRSFKIHDQEKFVQSILPKYFATTNEAWFLEQLNDYGFHPLAAVGPDQGSYYHEKFLRGMKFLSPQIVPQSAAGNGDDFKIVVNPGDEPVLKRFPICPPIPLQRMLREKGFAVSAYSNSFTTLRQASSIMAASQSDMPTPLRTLTPLDSTSLKLLLNKGGGQACFPLKLHRILHHLAENGNDDIMSWLPHGRAFVIRDQYRFVTELMPVYFERQSKFNSFTRQIHMYNFKQIQEGPDKFAYRHDCFLRDEPQLCLQMHRTKKARDVTSTEEPDYTKPPPPPSPGSPRQGASSCPMAVVTPTKADTAAVELMALQCMMREQGQGCAASSVYNSKSKSTAHQQARSVSSSTANSKHSRKTSTSTKKKKKTKPKTTTIPMSPAESVNIIMPMMPWLPTITPESLDTIFSTTNVRIPQHSWPLRLQRILDMHEAEGNDKIISWLPHGRAFTVHDPAKFISDVMPVYFKKTTKFNSFTRQLYEYSFRRYSLGPYRAVFYHPHFLRGQPHEALKITRIRRYKDGKSVVPEIPPAEPDLFDQLALPRIAAGATVDVPDDPLADAKTTAKATTTMSALTASSSSIKGPPLDDFDIFDEDDPELGLWREALDEYADV